VKPQLSLSITLYVNISGAREWEDTGLSEVAARTCNVRWTKPFQGAISGRPCAGIVCFYGQEPKWVIHQRHAHHDVIWLRAKHQVQHCTRWMYGNSACRI